MEPALQLTSEVPSGQPISALTRVERVDAYHRRLARFNDEMGLRFDATGVVHLARQLEELDTKLYEVKYPNQVAERLIPMRTGINAGAETYTYQVVDSKGAPKLMSGESNDLPELDIAGDSTSVQLYSYGAAYSYTVQQLRRGLMSGFGIDEAKAMNARRRFALNMENTMCTGDSVAGYKGLANNAGVSLVTPITGSWVSGPATADQVVADLNKLVSAIISDSKGIEEPDTIVLPYSLYAYADTVRLPNTTISALDYFRAKWKSLQVEQWAFLETAGASSVARIVCYRKAPEVLEGLAPVVFETFAPQPNGMTFKVPVHQRLGGVVVRYPGAIRYMDGC